MSLASTLEQKIRDGLEVTHLEIANESHMHNVPANAETHFRVVVVSPAFRDMMLVRRHQTINGLLSEQLSDQGPLHALALHTLTPEEWQAREGQTAASPACRGGAAADPEVRS